MTSIAIGVVLPDGDDELDWALARDTVIAASRVVGIRAVALTDRPVDQGWLPPGCDLVEAIGSLERDLSMMRECADQVILLNPVFAPITVDEIRNAAE